MDHLKRLPTGMQRSAEPKKRTSTDVFFFSSRLGIKLLLLLEYGIHVLLQNDPVRQHLNSAW